MAETSGTRLPTDFSEAVRYFSDPEVANEYALHLDTPPFKCRACKWQLTKAGTVFEGSSLGFDKWFPAVWVAANPETAVSSRELARALGVTQRSAWFMLRRYLARHGRDAVTS